ncbi:MAG: hypothetical protein ABH874_00835 [Methanobacteriota archaeon]
MENKICCGGIDTENRRWVRPIRLPTNNLLISDVHQRSIEIFKLYNKVRFLAGRRISTPPHTEDFEVDWSYTPSLIEYIGGENRARMLREWCENPQHSIKEYLVSRKRSLMLVRPDEIRSITINTFEQKMHARIQFPINERFYNLPCTDLKWRAYCRMRSRDEILREIQNSETYFTIGLSRLFKDDYWPMLVGVHTIPDYTASIDYNNL